MTDQADNPYAAPQAPPEAKPPAPWPAYLRAALAGSTGFVVGFTLAAALATLIFAVVNGYGSAAEIWEGARYEILTCCLMIGALAADGAARHEFRRRTSELG